MFGLRGTHFFNDAISKFEKMKADPKITNQFIDPIGRHNFLNKSISEANEISTQLQKQKPHNGGNQL